MRGCWSQRHATPIQTQHGVLLLHLSCPQEWLRLVSGTRLCHCSRQHHPLCIHPRPLFLGQSLRRPQGRWSLPTNTTFLLWMNTTAMMFRIGSACWSTTRTFCLLLMQSPSCPPLPLPHRGSQAHQLYSNSSAANHGQNQRRRQGPHHRRRCPVQFYAQHLTKVRLECAYPQLSVNLDPRYRPRLRTGQDV